jgi:hypothetical protein
MGSLISMFSTITRSLKNLLSIASHLDLFPKIKVTNRAFPLYINLLIFAIMTGLYYALARMIPCNGFFCWDWVYIFSVGKTGPFYPPWTGPILSILTYPILVGLPMAALSVAAFLRARSPFSLVCVFFCLPVLWTIFLGQLEGLVLLGLLGLPWLAPLALMKPQVSVFAFLAKKSSLIILIAVLLVSFLIWGFWPIRMLSVNQYYAEGRYVQDISLGLWGLLPALGMLWFSRGDVDMLMLAGSVTTLHLIPYNLMPVVPAVARLSKRSAAIA